MPEVFRVGGLKFTIYFKDHPPPHVHVMKHQAEAVFNLLTFECISSHGFSAVALNRIEKILRVIHRDLVEAWMSTKNKRISLGTIEVTDDELALKGSKIRISMMVDLDLLQAYKKWAMDQGSKYQTLMNQKLREALNEGSSSGRISDRLKRLEKKVFGRDKKRSG